MYHPDKDVNAALIRLADALCQLERNTGRASVLVMREKGQQSIRFMDGKPCDPDLAPDDELLSLMGDDSQAQGDLDRDQLRAEVEQIKTASLRNTAIFLADTWAKTQDVIYKSLSMSPHDGMEYLISNYPQMQGMRNQMQLRRLAALAFDSSAIPGEIAASLPNAPDQAAP